MSDRKLRDDLARYLVNGLARNPEQQADLARDFGIDPAVAPRQKRELTRQYDLERKRVLSQSLSDMDVKEMIRFAENTALVCVIDRLKMSQIRRFMDSVKRVSATLRLKEFDRSEVELLKIPLAYAAARQSSAMELMRTCTLAIDRIREGEGGRKDWERFEKFIEAIVAYHKFYGGGDD